MTLTQQRIGRQAEDLALSFLRKQGLTPVARNYRSKRGEIDLVMQDNDTIVFIEVRYRKQARFGAAAESVDARKQAKLASTALYFLQKFPRWQKQPARFDVIAVTANLNDAGIEWIKDAFHA